ncbi:hypothetical protein CRG98_005417 [Punica granatum]|uniref:Uncharacterized protein n=1 Tax=Punica granatum TaxID=22663 RepID=A0A2I0L0F7_PUNGR|nr:hypothetical protein CRG98_005417 [Punica granatum]
MIAETGRGGEDFEVGLLEFGFEGRECGCRVVKKAVDTEEWSRKGASFSTKLGARERSPCLALQSMRKIGSSNQFEKTTFTGVLRFLAGRINYGKFDFQPQYFTFVFFFAS